MTARNLKVFFMSVAGSVSVWWGMNMLSEALERAFFAYELKTGAWFLAAGATQLELEQKLEHVYPLRKKQVKSLDLQAAAALALYIREDGEAKVLYEKNSEAQLPIASITKLMTALVVLTHYEPDRLISITPEILKTFGEAGQLKEGDVLQVKDLLYLALMESSNRAAVALATPMGVSAFVDLMNQEAAKLNLTHTSFVNPTGLDEPLRQNVSTARELALFARILFERYPHLFDILTQNQLPLHTPDGAFHHTMRNTNELLGLNDWPSKMLGGKTGSTTLARQTLVLLVESPDGKGYIINVLLGSENRFQEMRQLLHWTLDAYSWEMSLPLRPPASPLGIARPSQMIGLDPTASPNFAPATSPS